VAVDRPQGEGGNEVMGKYPDVYTKLDEARAEVARLTAERDAARRWAAAWKRAVKRNRALAKKRFPLMDALWTTADEEAARLEAPLGEG
jgi:hypothetical protein